MSRSWSVDEQRKRTKVSVKARGIMIRQSRRDSSRQARICLCVLLRHPGSGCPLNTITASFTDERIRKAAATIRAGLTRRVAPALAAFMAFFD